MDNLKAVLLAAKTAALAATTGFGLFVAGHVLASLFSWELLPIDYTLLAASILFPVGFVLFVSIVEFDYIKQIANNGDS